MPMSPALRFFALTDTHSEILSPEIIPSDCRFVILAGDFSVFGRKWKDNAAVLNKRGIPVYFVLGNHELGFLEPVSIESAYPNFHHIGNKHEEIDFGFTMVRLVGIDGENNLSPEYEDDVSELEVYMNLYQHYTQTSGSSLTILVTHFQPAGLLLNDAYGSRTVKLIYDYIRPTLTICGHKHKAFGKSDTRFNIHNPGQKGMYFEISEGKILKI